MTKQQQKNLFFQSSLPKFLPTPEETRENASNLIKSKLLNEGVSVSVFWSPCGDYVAIFNSDDEFHIPSKENYHPVSLLLINVAFGDSIKSFVTNNQ